jgi:hypothetical protein
MFKKLAKTIASILSVTILLTWAFSTPTKAFQPFMTTSNAPYHWNPALLPNSAIQWHVESGVPDIAGDSLAAGLQAWSNATGGAFKFAQGPGGISVDWDTDGSKIPDPMYLAYTTFNADSTGKIIDARIIVNAHNYTWHRGGFGGVGPTVNGVRDSNLDSVLLHELGHALGLDHSDKNPSAIVGSVLPGDPPTMNSVIYPGAGTLHDDDRAGIRSLYTNGTITPPSQITVNASVLQGKAPLNVNFTQIGGDLSTTWDFGDGSNSSGSAAQHVFVANGAFTVTVDCLGTKTTLTILVGNKAIHAAATAKKKAEQAHKKQAKKQTLS